MNFAPYQENTDGEKLSQEEDVRKVTRISCLLFTNTG